MSIPPHHTSVEVILSYGYLPEAVVNYLALIGWSPGGGEELLSVRELARRFSIEGVGLSAGVFDEEKLAWVNRHYLKQASAFRLAELAVPYFQEAGINVQPVPVALEYLASVMPIASESVDRLDQVPARLSQL